MKYIRAYENIQNENIQVDDYVWCVEKEASIVSEENETLLKIARLWTSVNVGKFKEYSESDSFPFLIEYENLPSNIKYLFNHGQTDNCRMMRKDEIKFWSKDKNKVEQEILIKKFNI